MRERFGKNIMHMLLCPLMVIDRLSHRWCKAVSIGSFLGWLGNLMQVGMSCRYSKCSPWYIPTSMFKVEPLSPRCS